MCTTPASGHHATRSPSVWALGTCSSCSRPPFRCRTVVSSKVTTGRASGVAAGTSRPYSSTTCAEDSRARAFSWATTTAPACAKAALPPAWSGCQCVLTTNRTAEPPRPATASASDAAAGAVPLSTSSVPSDPLHASTLPPAPRSSCSPGRRRRTSMRSGPEAGCALTPCERAWGAADTSAASATAGRTARMAVLVMTASGTKADFVRRSIRRGWQHPAGMIRT